MSDISFNCPHCAKRLVVDEEGSGLKMQCPVCDQSLRIPDQSQPEDEAVAEVSDDVIRAIAVKAQRLRREAEPGEPVLIARDPEEDQEEELEEPELDLAFICPSCDHPLVVAYEGAGLDLQCPECAAGLDIPDPLHLPENFPCQRLATQILALQKLEDHTAPFAEFGKSPREVPLKPRRIGRADAPKSPALTESGLTMDDYDLLEQAQSPEEEPAPIKQKPGPRPAVSSHRKAPIRKPSRPLRFQTKGKTSLTSKLAVAPESADGPTARKRRKHLQRKAERNKTDVLLPRKLAEAAKAPRVTEQERKNAPDPEQPEPKPGSEAQPQSATPEVGRAEEETAEERSSSSSPPSSKKKGRRRRKGALRTPRLPVVETGAEQPFVPVGQHLKRSQDGHSRPGRSKVRLAQVLSPFLLAFLAVMVWVATVFFQTPEVTREHELVAPEQTSETDFQPREISPIEEQTARAALQGFFEAETWQEALPYLRDPERVRPLMREYYSDQDFEFEPIRELTLGESGWRLGRLLAVFAGVTEESFERRLFHLERMPDGQWKLDWETLVGYNPLSWAELKRRKPRDPVILRCSLSQGNYYNFNFEDREEYSCFRIHDKSGDFTGIYAYAERDSAPREQLLEAFEDSKMPALMIEVRYPENATEDNQVKILSVIRKGWIVL
jgi:transcription elongation factor Elf1